MTENDIKEACLKLAEALDAKDSGTAKGAIVALASQALVDLHRIADALEILASPPKAA